MAVQVESISLNIHYQTKMYDYVELRDFRVFVHQYFVRENVVLLNRKNVPIE